MARAPDAPLPRLEKGTGAALLLDIVGFTGLVDGFMVRGPSGAEELWKVLNEYFGTAVDIVASFGGDAAAFAGDAVLATWKNSPEEAVRRAAACGLKLQSELSSRRFGSGLALAQRISIATGEVSTLEVGSDGPRRLFAVSGSAIAALRPIHAQAKPGRVYACADSWKTGGETLIPLELTGGARAVGAVASGAFPASPSFAWADASIEAELVRYVPQVVGQRLHAGQQDWLAEFRSVTTIFIGLGGDDSTQDLAQLHAATGVALGVLDRYDGCAYQLMLDEKGTTLIAIFGLPMQAHEDDPARAVGAGLAIHAGLAAIGQPSRLGITTGLIFCGAAGSDRRRNYACLGSTMNMAARVMGTQKDGVLCDAATARAVRGRVVLEALPPVTVKGRAEPVEVFRPLGEVARNRTRVVSGVGRTAQRAVFARELAALLQGDGARIVVTGEPGIGKTVLLAEVLDDARAAGIRVLAGAADPIEPLTAFFAWRELLTGLFPAADNREVLRRAVSDALAGEPRNLTLLPILNALLPLDLPETPETSALGATGRAEYLHELVVQLLVAASAREVLAIVLEDVHWLDSASAALLAAVMDRVPRVAVILTSRPVPAPVPSALRSVFRSRRRLIDLTLPLLQQEEVSLLARRVLKVEAVPDALAAFVRGRTGGNPFYCEELTLALLEAGLVTVASGRATLVPDFDERSRTALPDSLQHVITSRIDRLPVGEQLAMKVASVIGRVFPFPTLRDVFPIRAELDRLGEMLEELTRRALTVAQATLPEASYAFSHAITQDVAYGLLVYAQRRQLHRAVAEWHEKAPSKAAGNIDALLAHHWSRAEEIPKALSYLERAAEHALQSNANKEVVTLLSEAMELARKAPELAPPARRSRWLWLLGEANIKLGENLKARDDFYECLRLAGIRVPRSTLGFAIALLYEVAVQTVHRFWPRRFFGRDGGRRDYWLLGAQGYQRAGELAYFLQDTVRLVHATVAAMNRAERAGPSRVLALSYSGSAVGGGVAASGAPPFMRGPFIRLARLYYRWAHEEAARQHDDSTTGYVFVSSAILDNTVGDWPAAQSLWERSAEAFARVGDRFRTAQALAGTSYQPLILGQFDETSRNAARTLAAAPIENATGMRIWGRAAAVSADLLRNQLTAENTAELEALLHQNPMPPERFIALGTLSLARLRAGDQAGAIRAVDEAIEVGRKFPPNVYFQMPAGAFLADTVFALRAEALAKRDPTEREHRARMKAVLKLLGKLQSQAASAEPRLRVLRGRHAAQEGVHGRARRELEAALALATRLNGPYDAALAHRELFLLDPQGPQASRHEAEARRILTGMGALYELERLDATRR